jgi:hypothetical protein
VRFKGISDLAIELAKPKNAFLPCGPRAINASLYCSNFFPSRPID